MSVSPKRVPVCGPRPGFRVAVLHDLVCAYLDGFLVVSSRFYRWSGNHPGTACVIPSLEGCFGAVQDCASGCGTLYVYVFEVIVLCVSAPIGFYLFNAHVLYVRFVPVGIVPLADLIIVS